jgi:hypothetical protein
MTARKFCQTSGLGPNLKTTFDNLKEKSYFINANIEFELMLLIAPVRNRVQIDLFEIR